MQKAVENFLFGLCFGMGFYFAVAVLSFLAGLLGAAAHAPRFQ